MCSYRPSTSRGPSARGARANAAARQAGGNVVAAGPPRLLAGDSRRRRPRSLRLLALPARGTSRGAGRRRLLVRCGATGQQDRERRALCGRRPHGGSSLAAARHPGTGDEPRQWPVGCREDQRPRSLRRGTGARRVAGRRTSARHARERDGARPHHAPRDNRAQRDGARPHHAPRDNRAPGDRTCDGARRRGRTTERRAACASTQAAALARCGGPRGREASVEEVAAAPKGASPASSASRSTSPMEVLHLAVLLDAKEPHALPE